MKFTPDQLRNRAKWVEELRSGQHKQGMGYLYTKSMDGETCYKCCLGVAANDVLGLYFDEYGEDDAESMRIYCSDLDHTGNLTEYHAYRLGISDQTVYISMNDSTGFTFDMIADYIEAESALGRSFTITEREEKRIQIAVNRRGA